MAETDLVVLAQSVREFRPRCPGCTLQYVIAEDAKPCSFYDCPGIPDELKVTCDSCLFDFVANEGQVKCEHDVCETALRLKGNVETYLAWVEILKAEERARAHATASRDDADVTTEVPAAAAN